MFDNTYSKTTRTNLLLFLKSAQKDFLLLLFTKNILTNFLRTPNKKTKKHFFI